MDGDGQSVCAGQASLNGERRGFSLNKKEPFVVNGSLIWL